MNGFTRLSLAYGQRDARLSEKLDEDVRVYAEPERVEHALILIRLERHTHSAPQR